MRANAELQLAGGSALLVPYQAKHVLKYHEWMQNTDLLEQTASEPLTIDEEYSMQRSWLEDSDKCTFIVLGPSLACEFVDSEIERMAGDVNLFLNDTDDAHAAEIEVMIAEPKYRRQGLGRTATLLMIWYGMSELGLDRFVAKIGFDNEASLSLFSGLGFTEASRCEYFKEITLELRVRPGDDGRAAIETACAAVKPFLTVYEVNKTDSV